MHDLPTEIERAIKAGGWSARQASIEAVGNPDMIRGMRRGRSPTADRLRALSDILDLDFYVGRRREPDPLDERRMELAVETAERGLAASGQTLTRAGSESGCRVRVSPAVPQSAMGAILEVQAFVRNETQAGRSAESCAQAPELHHRSPPPPAPARAGPEPAGTKRRRGRPRRVPLPTPHSGPGARVNSIAFSAYTGRFNFL